MLCLSLFRGAWSLIDFTLHGLEDQGIENLEIVWVCEPRWKEALEHRLASRVAEAAALKMTVVSLSPDAFGGWKLACDSVPNSSFLTWVVQGDELTPCWLATAVEKMNASGVPAICGASETMLHKAQSHGAWSPVGLLTLPGLPQPWAGAKSMLQAPPSLSGIVVKTEFVQKDTGLRWLLERPFLWDAMPFAIATHAPLATTTHVSVCQFFPDILPCDSIYQRERSLEAAVVSTLKRPEWLALSAEGWPDSLKSLGEISPASELRHESKTKTLLEKARPKDAVQPTPSTAVSSDSRGIVGFLKKQSDPPPSQPIGQWPRPGSVKPQAMDPAALEKFVSKAGQFSLDVFDTCVHRSIGRPADVFLLLVWHLKSRDIPCPNPAAFREARLTAERLAWHEANTDSDAKCDVPLDEIYHRLALCLGWTDAQTSLAKALEIEVESSLLYANPLMQKLINEAAAKKTPIRYLSDMYFPSAVIGDWLEKCQFPKFPVTVSCEAGSSKSSGELYPKLLEKEGWAAKSTHHIGDNAQADVTSAQKNGLQAFRFRDRKEEQTFFDQVVSPFDWQNDLTVSLTIGLARKFRRTQDTAKSETTIGLASQIGYEIVGPLLFGYALWLRRQAVSQKLKSLFFLARDGFWLEKVFALLEEKWSPVCGHSYVALSRESVMLAAKPKNQEQWLETCLATEANLTAEVVLKRAGLANSLPAKAAMKESFQSENPILVGANARWLDDQAKSKLQKILVANKKEASKKQEEISGLLNDYLSQQGYDPKHSALVDIGWAGTIPRLLRAALSGNADPAMFFFGSYLNPAQAQRQGFKLNAWYFEEGGIPLPPAVDGFPSRSQLINPVRNLLEMMVSSTEGKSTGFKRSANGKVERTQDIPDTDASTAEFLGEVHSKALQFAEDLLGHLKEESWSEDAQLDAYLDSVLYRLLWIPKPREAKILGSIKFQSTAFGCLDNIPSVVLPEKNSQPRPVETLLDSHNRSTWKRGWLSQLTAEEMHRFRTAITQD